MVAPGTYNGTIEQLFTSGPLNGWFYLNGTGPSGVFQGWIKCDNSGGADSVTNMMMIVTAASHAKTFVTAFVTLPSGNAVTLYG